MSETNFEKNGEIIVIPSKRDRIAELEAENLALRAKLAQLQTEVEELRDYKRLRQEGDASYRGEISEMINFANS